MLQSVILVRSIISLVDFLFATMYVGWRISRHIWLCCLCYFWNQKWVPCRCGEAVLCSVVNEYQHFNTASAEKHQAYPLTESMGSYWFMAMGRKGKDALLQGKSLWEGFWNGLCWRLWNVRLPCDFSFTQNHSSLGQQDQATTGQDTHSRCELHSKVLSFPPCLSRVSHLQAFTHSQGSSLGLLCTVDSCLSNLSL